MTAEGSDVVRVRIHIEPHWTISHYDTVIEIDAADLEGLPPTERENRIIEIGRDTVNEVCSWAATELTDEED